MVLVLAVLFIDLIQTIDTQTIYTHNLNTVGKPRISVLNCMLLVTIRLAISKPWQVQYEINIEIGGTFLPNLSRLYVVELDYIFETFQQIFICCIQA